MTFFCRVFDDAPRLSHDDYMPWKDDNKPKPRYDNKRDRRRSAPMYGSSQRHSYDSRSSYHRKHKHSTYGFINIGGYVPLVLQYNTHELAVWVNCSMLWFLAPKKHYPSLARWWLGIGSSVLIPYITAPLSDLLCETKQGEGYSISFNFWIDRSNNKL